MKIQLIVSLIASLAFISNFPSITLAERPPNLFQKSHLLAQNSSSTIQSLPNGKYLYVKRTNLNPPHHNQYILFVKQGNAVLGYKYNSGAEECFGGTLNGNTITNVVYPSFTREGNLSFRGSDVTYLGNSSYRLNLNEVSHEAELGLQECLGIFSRER
ncbi:MULTISPECIES: hypothetical protein [Planktothrix]|uniref:Uncharacterized protein n=1 Tax=Planktothrix rubescens CCAP 1459/22 TaxID=329571 RepID=A0A6J7ZF77_PLARU|nr:MULTISPECIES: hypothetical protein [Planktothrix]CAC5339757.1 conserved exported hypothetical protein [Planktothrix rubescens NIVA-CYA 18]CAD5985212.1 hypothetical protein PCC7821_04925 [Planktothrix rubescens NIVA-CYA 18]